MSGKTDIEEVYLTKLLGIHEDLQNRLELKGLKLFACLHFRDISIFYDVKILSQVSDIHCFETSGRHNYHTEVAYERFPSQAGIQFVNNCQILFFYNLLIV